MLSVIENVEKWDGADFDGLEQARIMDTVKLFLPQTVFFDPGEAACGRFEYFHLEDADSFCGFMEGIGFHRKIKLGFFNVNEQRVLKVNLLPHRTRERICEIYAQDFLTFGYSRGVE